MTTYSAAAYHWWQEAEAATLLYSTELATYAEGTPRPTLKDFMVQLGREWASLGPVT
jgi:hypothetical protein